MIFEYSIEQLSEEIRSRRITARSVMEVVYDNIERYNPQLNAYLSVLPREKALQRAEAIDKKAAQGQPLGKLAGIPISSKANIAIKDPEFKISCASKMLENFSSPYNATVIDSILKEEGLIIGITNMDEFAMGSSTENSAFGATQNPWDLNRVPGGSSGGAAVTISARMALLALGSDTGGSIRQPASMCGVTGIKPTYGAVSRYGLVAYGSSLDQIGCLAQRAEDCRYALEVIQGYDPYDSTSLKNPLPQASSSKDLAQLKFCLPEEYVTGGSIDPDVIESVMSFVQLLQKNGATVEKRSLPFTQYVVPTYYILAFAEASSNLGRFDGIRYGVRQQEDSSLDSLYKTSRSQGFGEEVKRRIMLGTFVLSAGYYDQYYAKANKVRMYMEREVDALFGEFDYILGPVSPFPAFKLGEKSEDPLSMYLADIYSALSNLTRTPAISIPGQPSQHNLPIGIQLMGKKGSDFSLLNVSQQIQSLIHYHQQRPPLNLIP
ncbi:Asp-tRNA(Asn)/Glu-tRNA(Gln) amidotransferase subunit GatA [Deltaproteobacteria bacterium TL4]